MTTSRQVVLAKRPAGPPTVDDLRFEDRALRQPDDGDVVLRVIYLSLDPYMRGRMSDAKSYADPVPIGGVMEGETISEVISSRHPNFKQGDLVRGRTGWQTHDVLNGEVLKHVDTRGAPLETALGILGMPGFTAYSGMKLIGRPKPGETVVVAAASGPVGSLVGQLAKMAGARAVGIAGGSEKCAYVEEELGFDAAIDHTTSAFPDQLRAACPNGIDVYFENVGGHVWDAVLPLLNRFSRVPVCGLIANYNGSQHSTGDKLAATMNSVLRLSVTMRGFINYEFEREHYASFLDELAPLVEAKKLRHREDIVDGLENAPGAFIGMLKGKNFGKLLVRVGADV
ncbi:NADP-dependent oxidoreductase [Rhizobium sp. Rhizsp82]|uniref:NADP-dependent oxidoreductase n=1 Tax=Rhizobium sp. Rhizsp82 TaxID=3243057 RepID=UPI0039B4DBF4